jgi:hypothetical protein
MSDNDLLNLLGKIQNVLKAANASVDPRFTQEELTLEDGEATILKLTHGINSSLLSVAPPVAYSMDYVYSADPGSAISGVELRFHDYSRRIEVSGHSREQVEALFLLISNNVQSSEGHLGGGMFRAIAAAPLGTLGVSLILLSLSPMASSRRKRTLFSVLGVVAVLSLFLLPWEKLLPGVAIYSGDSSFLVREGPAISFAGFVVTVAAFITSLMLPRHPNATHPSTTSMAKRAARKTKAQH